MASMASMASRELWQELSASACVGIGKPWKIPKDGRQTQVPPHNLRNLDRPLVCELTEMATAGYITQSLPVTAVIKHGLGWKRDRRNR